MTAEDHIAVEPLRVDLLLLDLLLEFSTYILCYAVIPYINPFGMFLHACGVLVGQPSPLRRASFVK